MIKRVFFILLVTVLVFPALSSAHTYKSALIVDTDMALDDIRAIIMLLNSNSFDIPLIVASDGAVTPQVGCRNLCKILNYLGKNRIKVAAGRLLKKPAPAWRLWSEELNLPLSHNGKMRISTEGAAEAITTTLMESKKNFIYLCLGPLTNLADALTLNPRIRDKISRVVFIGGSPGDFAPGWNYMRDPESVRIVFKSGLNIYCLNVSKGKVLPFNQKLLGRIKGIKSRAACAITGLYKNTARRKLLSTYHSRVWDEMAVIYLSEPYLFIFRPVTDDSRIMRLINLNKGKVLMTYLNLLKASHEVKLIPGKLVVLSQFSTDPDLFRQDLAPFVKKIVKKYGVEEWKVCVLTNEFHHHLGIYSIIGAKMGLRAREILGANPGDMQVISHAGQSPPFSCMIDGLQVATGSTLGRGNIEVLDDNPRPSATFVYNGKRITLTLKEEIKEQIQAEIKDALRKCGGLNRRYFEKIRSLGIKYWLELDRTKIFDCSDMISKS